MPARQRRQPRPVPSPVMDDDSAEVLELSDPMPLRMKVEAAAARAAEIGDACRGRSRACAGTRAGGACRPARAHSRTGPRRAARSVVRPCRHGR
ncbi:hypothetical protein P0F65_11275 [Sphingomonas sp. I4]